MQALSQPFTSLLLAVTLGSTIAAQPIEGLWTGTVDAPQGGEAIALEIARTQSGRLVATMWMPVMHVSGLRLGLADDGVGRFSIPPLDTSMRIEGDALVGSFALGRLPIRLTRGGEIPAAPASPETPAGPAPAWQVSLRAGAWASPVVRDGIVYIGTIDGAMHARRASDGAEVWKLSGHAPIYGTSLVTDEAVFVIDESSSLNCLERSTGTSRWRSQLYDGESPPPANPSYNHRTAAPVLADGTLYAGSADGGLYAIDPATGSRNWRAEIGGPVLAAPAVARAELVVTSLDGSVVVVSALDGSELRRTKLPGGVTVTPAIVDGIAVIGCRDYILYGLNLADLSIAWRYSYWFSWVESTPRVDGTTVYVGSSDYRRVSAIDAVNGKAIWAADTGGLTWGTPAIAGNTVFAGAASQRGAMLPHTGGLVAIDRTSGSVKWRHTVALADGFDRAGFIGSLTVSGNLVIGASADGSLMAFPAD